MNMPQPNTPDDPGIEQNNDSEIMQKAGDSITRRSMNKVLGLLGLTALVDRMSQGSISKSVLDTQGSAHNQLEEDTAKIAKKFDEESGKIVEKIQKESPGLSDIEKARKAVDYLGALIFAWGLYDLSPLGRGHIGSAQYGALAALSSYKYSIETAEVRHHLVDETKSTIDAFFIINGTIAFAEGLNLDLQKSYEDLMKRKPSDKDKIASMTMFSSLLSPLATTVGSASVIRKMSSDFSVLRDDNGAPKRDDKGKVLMNESMMAAFQSHVSNLSGFILFGDPPFIAVAEKYGFKEGVEWQMKTMWPLAMYSLFSSTYKLNMLSLEAKGMKRKDAAKAAVTDTLNGLLKNVPFIAKIAARSLGNAAKYFSAADMKFQQDPAGMEVKIGEILSEKIKNIARLPFDPELDKATHESHEGMAREIDPEIRGGNTVVEGFVRNYIEQQQGGKTYRNAESHKDTPPAVADFMKDLREAIEMGDYDRIMDLGSKNKIPNVAVLVATLRDFHDDKKINHSDQEVKVEGLKEKLNPLKLYERSFELNRIKNAVGHNMGDVVNVFPFQAGCVPFLITIFKDGLSSLDKAGLSPAQKEAALFFALMMFSAVADNYVACKVGLEVLPEKPHISLIASITGGSLTAIGNMANVAQFNLDQYPLVRSIANMYWHLDDIAVAGAWAAGLNIFQNLKIVVPPKVKGAQSAEKHAGKTIESDQAVAKKTPESTREETRRDFFRRFAGKPDSEES